MMNTMQNTVEYYMNALYYNVWCCWRAFFLDYPASKGDINNKKTAASKKNSNNFNNMLQLVGLAFESFYIVGVWGSFIFPLALIPSPIFDCITSSESLSTFLGFCCLTIGFYPLYRYVLWHDRYVKFFKIFRRKSKAWHKKWRIIAIVFVIVSWLMFVCGVVGMVYVGELLM